ncbi:MAG: DUF952 domain-containing protein [Spirosomataceae bacterium]
MIYHVIIPSDWEHWATQPHYEAPSLHTEGFIHCSTATQIAGVLERYYAPFPEVLLLHINEAALVSPLVYEPSTGGELFPHVYGPIHHVAITKVSPIKVNGVIQDTF